MVKKIFQSFILILFLLPPKVDAQESINQVDSLSKDINIIALPVVFFLPETSWAFGLAGNFKFRRTKDPDSKPSQINLGGAYTLNKQILSYLSYRLFSKDSRWWWAGEFGYFDYVFDFEGVGFNERFPLNKFFTTFPEIKTKLSYEIAKDYFVGLGYYYADYRNVSWQSDSIYNYEITGVEGAKISGLQIVAATDKRDNIVFPRKGHYTELKFFTHRKGFGSEFKYNKIQIDYRKYFSLGETVLAFQLFSETNIGNTPFQDLAKYGGGKISRGYQRGAYRDQNMQVIQAAYRFPLFWRFSMGVFGSVGTVSKQIFQYKDSELLWAGGGGLRFAADTKDQLNIRFDVGFGKNSLEFYFTIGEAF